MIFQATLDQVLDGSKTETRRLWKDDWIAVAFDDPVYALVEQVHPRNQYKFHHRAVYYIGQTLAVQPARTAKGIARIEIVSLRKEPLEAITEEGARAEGCQSRPAVLGGYYYSARTMFTYLWDSIHKKPGERWKDNPDVVVIGFKLVKS